ncbi:MAG: TonB-dependent receptor [Prevotella sp.]|nr:TonB-dependent receptor [Prevotella sp.]
MKHNNIIKYCLSLAVMIMFAASAYAQQAFKGNVVDEAGEPIIGATVKIIGGGGATITDFDGNFTISVPKGKELEISYIGYVTQKVSNFKNAKIVMKEDAQSLGEVVVVGYGTQKKAHLTGSVATVPVDEIQDLASTGLASTLSGLVNGLGVSGGNARPGETARISIRNANDMAAVGSSETSPLYVIDGYIYPIIKVGNSDRNLGEEAFNNLDASMVENISVLKDAAAAVYGARAANGVILVTTKKGKQGKPKISYSGQFGINDAVSHPKMLNSYQYGKLFNAMAAADPKKTYTYDNILHDRFQADELEAMKSLNYDLLDKYWESSLTQRHSVNVGGATEKVNYFGGLSYFKQDGNLGNLDYDRWNYNAGVNVDLSDHFKASLSVSGDYGKKNKPLNKVGGTNSEKDYNLLLTRPYYMPEEVDGRIIAAYGPSNSQKNANQLYSFSALEHSGDYSNSNSNNMSVSGSLEYDFDWLKPLKGLRMKFSYSKSIAQDKSNEYGSSYNAYYMNTRFGSGEHLYTPIPGVDQSDLLLDSNFKLANGGTAVSNGGKDGYGYLSRSMSRADNYQMNFVVSYNRDFGKHHVAGLFTIEKSKSESEWLYGNVQRVYPFSNGQSNSGAPQESGDMTTTFTRSEAGMLSYVGRINYVYNDTYLLEFLFREDSSTRFAPENRWGFFPSLSGGWIVSQEPWFDNVKWIDYLKVRASFGLTGRDNTTPWMWRASYGMDKDKGTIYGTGDSNNSGNRISMNKNNSAINRDATWDKSYKANFGIDFNVLNNRLGVNIDAYYVWNRDMLLAHNVSLAGTIGTQSAKENWGEMDSWGVELSLNWKDKIGKDFKYKIGINTGYSDNKMLEMEWATENIYRSIRRGHRLDIGTWGMQCIGMFRSFQDIEEYFNKYNITSYLGMSKDDVRPGMLIYKDVRGAQQADGTYAGPDGIVDEKDDQVCLSNRSNPWGFTTNLSAEYKSFSISAQLSASWGGYSFVTSQALKPAQSIEFTNMPSFWNPDNMFVYEDVVDAQGNVTVKQNLNGALPNLAYSNVNSLTSNFWRVSGTRIQLNRLTLAYKLPSTWIKPLGLENVRLNVTGQNLISFLNPYPDNFMDPMTSYGSYPALRKFTIGLNVSF